MTNHSVAVLHTTPVTIPLVKELLSRQLPDYQVINFLDDSILPMLNCSLDNMPFVMEKLRTYVRYAEKQGATAVLCACSSIGEIADQAEAGIPVMRIDEAMMTEAAQIGKPVLLCATLATTLEPSERLLQKKCAGRVEVESCLLSDAYHLLQTEGKEAHDRAIAKRLEQPMREGKTIVLAQASMAAAAQYMPKDLAGVMLTSPESGVELFAKRVQENA